MERTLLTKKSKTTKRKRNAVSQKQKMTNAERVVESLVFIEWNITEDINASVISKEVGYSVEYFRKLFKKVTGFGVERYISMRRMTEILKRLVTGKENVFKLTHEYRFTHYRSFSRTFTRLFRISPTEIYQGQSLKPFPLQEAIIYNVIKKNGLQ